MENKDKIRILIIDDEQQFTEELSGYLIDAGYIVFQANTAKDGKWTLLNKEIDILILDVQLPGANGIDILQEVKKQYHDMEVIIVSGHGGMDTVINAMRLGAFDYLPKPFGYIDIKLAIERTHKFLHIQRKLKQVEEKNSLISKTLEGKIDRHFIGVSIQIQDVFDKAVTYAGYPDANVLISGESGTGKENIARIIHYSSPRKDNVFCAVNSSAITESLLNSEFFGHKKGSFTGATNDRMGFFEVSNQGTLFLDEIADMPLNLQAKILRATEEKVITRVGDTKQIYTDFRIISATNHDIEQKVKDKSFRLDLLHRLNTLHIHIPPLRERQDDIKPLLNHFVNTFSASFNKPHIEISDEVYVALQNYDFPGNVRELKNMTERAVILCKGNTLTPNDFPITPQQRSVAEEAGDCDNLKIVEFNLINKVLKKFNYNQQAAADALGIHRDALSRKMKKHNIIIGKNKE
ncbi:MAG: sigma-54 dependent transcriptional regulator [bacterium]